MTKKASEKRKTFNREFREARAAFRINPTEKNFTFTSKVDGGKKTVLKKGETKQGLMKKFKAEFNSAAPTKTTDSTPGFLKRKATGKRIVKNTKLADVTKEELNSWKEKNKGLYKGKALTAYLNAKGKNLSEPKTAENKINTAIRKIAKFKADGTVEGPGQKARPGRLTAGQRAAQNLVYKKSGGKLGGNPEVKRKMAKFKADGTVEGQAQKARPGAKAKPTLKEKLKPEVAGSSNKKTLTELKLKVVDLRAYLKQLTKLLKDPVQQRRWAKLSNEDKEKIKKSVIRSGRSIFKALDTVSPRAINTSEIKITKPKPTDKNPDALKGTNFLQLLQKSSRKAQSAYADLSAGEKRAVKSLVREEGLSLPQAVSRIKNG